MSLTHGTSGAEPILPTSLAELEGYRLVLTSARSSLGRPLCAAAGVQMQFSGGRATRLQLLSPAEAIVGDFTLNAHWTLEPLEDALSPEEVLEHPASVGYVHISGEELELTLRVEASTPLLA